MKIIDLPIDIQRMAAHTLFNIIISNKDNPIQQAKLVRDAFITLYLDQQSREAECSNGDQWLISIIGNKFEFKRTFNGKTLESYPPVERSKATLYATAIVNGLQPPRGLCPSDKPID
ncbi:UNVERIFIED_ORG: hypothetical protein EC838_0132 [Providencia alcalifaciens]